MNIEDWDIVEYLAELGIDCRESGQNVGRNSVGICCLNPECIDSNYHLGINLKGKYFYCWKCHAKGGPVDLIALLEGISIGEAFAVLKSRVSSVTIEEGSSVQDAIENILGLKESVKEEKVRPKEIVLPVPQQTLVKDVYQPYYEYLVKRRKFSWEIIKTWDCYYCSSGNYGGYLIFPVYLKGELVTYTSRTVYTNRALRYMSCPEEESILVIKDSLYLYDEYDEGDEIILCEGLFDVLRLRSFGYKALGLFSNHISANQLNLLAMKQPGNIKILLDRGESANSESIGNDVRAILSCPVKVLTMEDYKDPGICTDPDYIKALVA